MIVDSFQINNQIDSRLDIYLVKKLQPLSRSRIKTYIEKSLILVNDNKTKPGYMLQKGDLIKVNINKNAEVEEKLIAEDIEIKILYEDENIIAINKPSGLIVHPGINNHSGTLANGLIYHFKNLSNINGELRPGIVHRLDAETSGVMLIAKNNDAHLSLAKQFKDRTINKKYMSITWGKWAHEHGEIEGWISRKKSDPTTFIFNNKLNIGKYSKTKYVVEKQYVNFAKVLFYPLTGRTHQIRVHSSFCGNPIFGDKKYGGGQKKSKQYKPEINKFFANQLAGFGRFALHAYSIDFNLINKGQKRIKIEAPIPKEFVDLENTILNYES